MYNFLQWTFYINPADYSIFFVANTYPSRTIFTFCLYVGPEKDGEFKSCNLPVLTSQSVTKAYSGYYGKLIICAWFQQQ